MSVNELPVSVYFITDPCTFEREWIENFPGNYDEFDNEGKCFFKTSVEVTRPYFLLACETMLPLFGNRPFVSLSVGIDALDFFEGHATYFTDRSDRTAGKYFFLASSSLLSSYLLKYWKCDFELSPLDTYIWHHEIIHMLDHDTIVDNKNLRRAGLKKFWTRLFLSYRAEGLADLFMLGKGHNSIRDMDEAFRSFRTDLESFVELSSESLLDKNGLEDLIVKVSSPYSLGPWLLIHSMLLSDNSEMVSFASKIESMVRQGEILSDKDILKLVNFGLKISNEHFINCLMLRGKSGIVFLGKENIKTLNGMIN